MTIVVGITGGMGSGKSTLTNELRNRNLKVLDSDELVSKIYKKPTRSFLNHLKKIKLGDSIKGKNIDKKLISDKIFSDTKTKKELENFIFKIVRKKRNNFIKKEKQKNTKIIFLDIPLLFENNLKNKFNIVISIISTKKNRYKRLKISRKITKSLFNKILKSQTTDIERKNNSDIIIYNNKSKNDFKNKIRKIINDLVI